MKIRFDLSEIPSGVQRRLEGELTDPKGLAEGLRPIFVVLSEGVRASWQSDGRGSVDLPLTEVAVDDLAALVARSLAMRDAFAKGPWPQIAELFNAVLFAIREERLLRDSGRKRRRREAVFGGSAEAEAARADNEWKGEPPV